MSARPFRCQVRLTISDLDAGVYADHTVVLAQHPDEPDEHVLLRFLFWVFCYQEGLQDAQGWTERSAPDVIGHDLTGEVTLWGEAGTPPMKRLTKALSRHKDARVVVLFADADEAADFDKQLRAARPRDPERIERLMVDRGLMDRLEQIGTRNMRWNATITEGDLYLDCDGETLQGGVLPWQ